MSKFIAGHKRPLISEGYVKPVVESTEEVETPETETPEVETTEEVETPEVETTEETEEVVTEEADKKTRKMILEVVTEAIEAVRDNPKTTDVTAPKLSEQIFNILK